MIANFFRTLTDQHVEYLLISGQASVLYGAATFSEDIDLWVNPTDQNRDRFLAALRQCCARYYKLTPPFTLANLCRGHGFHFLVPAADEPEIFLDVLGTPPRVGSFVEAVRSSQWIDGEWGQLHVIGLRDLVELKKTQRLEDYPVISRLALAWLDQPGCNREATDLTWAVTNIFTLPELSQFLRGNPSVRSQPVYDVPAELNEFRRQLDAADEVSEEVTEKVNRWQQERIARLQQADRQYWRGIIAELRSLRQSGQLMIEGSAV